MFQVPSERIALALDGPSVEVERIHSWSTQHEGLQLARRFGEAAKGTPSYLALSALFGHFLANAQPQWDIVDHLGAVPISVEGMHRLPFDISLPIVTLWHYSLATQPVEEERPPLPGDVNESEAPSAADAVLPPAAAREVKRRLRSVA